MALLITKPNSIVQYDGQGNLIQPTYWRITQLTANPIAQTAVIVYSGYPNATAFNANPAQVPIACQTIAFPDPVNSPNAAWPFAPATLIATYPGNPLALLLAADAYAMLNPFFTGASEVS